METKIEFTCPYTIEERYQMVTTGEYGVFEIYSKDGDVTGYRGYRKEYGTTGVYDNYRDAMEAALTEFGPKRMPFPYRCKPPMLTTIEYTEETE